MAKHVKLPGWVPIHKYMSKAMLGGIKTLAWLATDKESELAEAIQDYFPDEHRVLFVEALREIGVLAQEALKRQPEEDQ